MITDISGVAIPTKEKPPRIAFKQKAVREIPCNTLDEINSMDFPEPEYLVEGIIPKVGLGVIAGNPKAGKSFLALQLACCVATGTPFLNREVLQGDVLYLALEDNQQRIDWRSQATKELLGVDSVPNLSVHTQNSEWLATLKNGGLDSIKKWIDDSKNPRLVIIDTLQVFLGVRSGGADSYQQDTEVIAPIQEIVMTSSIASSLIHHMNKGGGVMGSQAILGSSDWFMQLQKEEEDTNGILKGKGRDIEEFSETLVRKKVNPEDKRGYIWDSLGETKLVKGNQETVEVIGAGNLIEMEHLTQKKPIGWTLDDLMAHIGNPNPKTKDKFRKRLERMSKKGDLEKRGKYFWINILRHEVIYTRDDTQPKTPTDIS